MTQIKIAILGAESTGKSTLSHGLASALDTPETPAVIVDEYLREWCLIANRTPVAKEQFAISQEQSRRIHTQSSAIVVADTTALMTAVYSDVLFDDTGLYPEALMDIQRFQHVLVTATDLPWVADSYLRDSPDGQRAIHQRLQEVLRNHGIAYSMVYGRDAQRLQAALAIVRPDSSNADAESQTYRRWMAKCEKCSDAACEHRVFRNMSNA